MADPPLGRAGVFTSAEARRAGWSAGAIRHAEASGRWQRLRPGVFAVVAAPDADPFAQHRQRHLRAAIAAAVSSEWSVVSHTAAALGHGLPVLDLPARPCLTVPPRTTRGLVGVHVHERALPASRCVRYYGVRFTDVARTVMDISCEGGVRAGLVVADAALGRGLTTRAELARAAAEAYGRPGTRAGRRVVDFADGRSESPLESLSRLALDELVPSPQLQSVILDELGRFIARVDMLWPELGVVGEADGFGKYTDVGVLHAEKRRQERLEEHGLIVVRWGMSDLADADALVARVLAAHRRAAQPGRRWNWTYRGAATSPRFPLADVAG